MNFQFQPGDTLQTCLARLLNSGDWREPIAQYLAQIIQTFGPGESGGGGGGGDGGGGGGGTDPNAVQKTGDTMSGPLIISTIDGSGIFSVVGAGSTQGGSITLAPNELGVYDIGPTLTIKNGDGTFAILKVRGGHLDLGPTGLRTDTATDNVTIGTTGINLASNAYVAGQAVLLAVDQYNSDLVVGNNQTGSGMRFQTGVINCRIHFSTDGIDDLLVTNVNTGKTVNLTNGFVATSNEMIYTQFQWVSDGQSNPSKGGQLDGNQTTPEACTVLAVNDKDRNNVNVAAALRMMDVGSRIAAQDTSNPDAWVKYNVTAAATHQAAGYTYIPVSVAGQGPAGTSGWNQVTVAFVI